jgi:hypothetical protein
LLFQKKSQALLTGGIVTIAAIAASIVAIDLPTWRSFPGWGPLVELGRTTSHFKQSCWLAMGVAAMLLVAVMSCGIMNQVLGIQIQQADPDTTLTPYNHTRQRPASPSREAGLSHFYTLCDIASPYSPTITLP